MAPDTDVERSAGKIWSIGTLTYTSGGLVILFCWLLFGDFAWSMRDRSVGSMASWYLSSLTVPNLLFGLLLSSFPSIVGMVLGPVISVKSDRHRGRWGRRIPFLLLTTPIAAFGMIGLAATPHIATWAHGQFPAESEMVVAVVCFGIFWAAFEFATIASQAVFGGLINDVVPKPFVGRFYGMFRAVSLIGGIIFNYWIMGKVPDHFTVILASIGVFYGAAFMLMCFKVKEGEYPLPPPLAPARKNLGQTFVAETGAYFRECFTSTYYVSIFIMAMFAGLAFGPVNAFGLPYARSLGVDMDAYGKSLALTYGISFSLSFFLGWLADRFHPLRLTLFVMAGYALVTAWGWFYVKTPGTFLVAWVLHGVLSGCYFTGAASMGQRLFPYSKFAQFTSAAGLMLSLCSIGLAPLTGILIDNTGGAFRHAFAIASLFSVLSFAAAWRVYGSFMKLGGPKGYIAP